MIVDLLAELTGLLLLRLPLLDTLLHELGAFFWGQLLGDDVVLYLEEAVHQFLDKGLVSRRIGAFGTQDQVTPLATQWPFGAVWIDANRG